VRSAVDIVDVIGATLELRPQGRNFLARCPWHDDRRPSMTINQDRQTWKCWPCDIGGDVFSFVMRRDGVDFPTAVRTLAELAGIPVEEQRRGKPTTPGSPEDKGTLLEAVRLVSDAYFQELQSGGGEDARLARDYLAERGIDDESRQRFRIGFAPDAWRFAIDLLQQHHFRGEVALAAGVASARTGGGFVDMFRGRLIFPIHDLQRRPIALGGRIIPAIAQRHGDRIGGKYINGRETLLFHKSQQLYGLELARDAIRRSGEVLVMEGYTDVVAARQAGIEPVVAVLGTALGEQHVKILKRLGNRVVLVLDGDEAGQRRADEVLELFVRAEVDLRVLTLPDGNDPAEFLATHGPEALQQLVREAPDALDHKLAGLTAGIDFIRDTHAVTTAVETMLRIVARAPDGLRTDQLLVRMSRNFDLKPERLERRLQVLRGEERRQAGQRAGKAPTHGSAPVRLPGGSAAPNLLDPNAALAESAEAGDLEQLAAGAGEPRLSAPPAPLPALSMVDLKLFEVLLETPELVSRAIEAIDPQSLETSTAKMLFSAYEDLEHAGHPLDGDTLLLCVENEQLKNQIVSLQERLSRRRDPLPDTPHQRLHALVAYYHNQTSVSESAREIGALESATLDEDEELARLKAIIARHRAAHETRRQT
jgi:DNA primase